MTPRGHNLVTTVDELINPVTGSWDVELIRDLFWYVDVHRILQIPLVAGREDFVAWHYDAKGVFSVKSAYHVLDVKKEFSAVRQRGESSGSREVTSGQFN